MFSSTAFQALTEAVKAELLRTHYKEKRIISHYEPTWTALAEYMAKRNIESFDMKTGLNFLSDEYGITVFENLNSSKGAKVRAVNMLGEYQLHGIILSKRRKLGKNYYHAIEEVFQQFIDSRRLLGISEKTLKSNELYLSRFSEYLGRQKIKNISALSSEHVLGFVNTLAGYSKVTIFCSLCSLRVLLRYLYDEKILQENLSYVVPRITIDKTARIPSAYSREEVQKMLDSVDRGNPKGKRDYAMLLLAARLGMRAGDICDLRFDNIIWDKNEIVLTQGKTGVETILPLLPEVGSALIDYLKCGRPTTELPQIFVRQFCPIGPLVPSTLHSIVGQYLRLAKITIPEGKKHGPHALRHSLASALLEENIKLPTIAQVLGHVSSETTSVYLKIGINQLRQCALTVPDFAWNRIDGGDYHAF